MRRLEAAGICLFCPATLREHPRQQVIFETRHWAVTPNEFPYPGTRLHLLVVPHQHVNDMVDLDDDALADFWTALRRIRERFDLDHYGLGVRNGNCNFTGATSPTCTRTSSSVTVTRPGGPGPHALQLRPR